MSKIFVSATSRDLRSYRQKVAEWGKNNGHEIVVQDDFEVMPDYKTIAHVLRDKLAPCDAVIHLAGAFYGYEPTNHPTDHTRRSYTQLEYELAKELKRPVFRFIARSDYVPDNPIQQTPDQADLQQKHIARLTQGCEPYSATSRTTGNELFYEFSTPDDLLPLLDKIRIPEKFAKTNMLPFGTIGTLFKGRDEFLAQLRESLINKPTHITAVVSKQAIYGLGGIGKTRAAVEYGWKYGHEYTALLFVRADSADSFRANLAQLCGALVLPERNITEQAAQVQAAVRWLKEHAGWFLIIDNVDTEEAAAEVESYLAQFESGHVVITSRLANWSHGVEALSLDVLSEQAGVEFILEKTQGKRRNEPTDNEDTLALVRDLDGLALALEQAGAFIAKNRTRIKDYHTRWQKHESKVLEWFDERQMKYPKSVAITWQTTIEKLTDDGKRLLNVLCWLSPDPISRDLAECIPADEQYPIDVESGLADLTAYSLAKWNEPNDAITIHRLVEEITRYHMQEEEKQVWLERAVNMMDAFIPEEPTPYDVRSWPKIYVPNRKHMEALTGFAFERNEIPKRTTRILNNLAGFLETKAEYSEAETLMRRSLHIDESLYGKAHATVAIGLSNLAVLLKTTNRYSEAEPLLRRALEIDIKLFGKDHFEVARDINNLATILCTLHRFAEAEPLMRRALEIDERTFGKDHPIVARDMNNLAQLFQMTNRILEAEPLMKQVLEIDRNTYGENHPKVASSMNNLASLFEATNRLNEAEELMRKALKIDELNYGEDHPDVAKDLNNLAAILLTIGKLSEAEVMMRRALKIHESIFGKNHPYFSIGLNNLVSLLYKSQRYNEAEEPIRQALEIDELSFGKNHPQVTTSLNNLALLLKTMNRFAEAEPLMRRVLDIDQIHLGQNHPSVARDLTNLSRLLYATEQFIEAERMMRRAVDIICAQEYEHPHKRATQENYRILLENLEKCGIKPNLNDEGGV